MVEAGETTTDPVEVAWLPRPLSIAREIAPATFQERVDEAPKTIVEELALKDVITGTVLLSVVNEAMFEISETSPLVSYVSMAA